VSALEWVAVGVTVVSVWLTVRQNPWCWPLGIVSVALYSFVFWREKLYADAGLQVVYVAVCAYGWWAWLRGGPGAGVLRVSRTPRRASVLLFVAGAVLAAVLGLTLKRATDASLPFWDAGTTAFSLVAQWMQARKWLENWLVWIVVDVVYVGMYVQKGLAPTALLYAGFVVLALLGVREWTRALRAGTEGR
jgi:nicotinamide mononucleotide transporter